MKKFILNLMLMLLLILPCAFIFAACDNGDSGTSVSKLVLETNGQTYESDGYNVNFDYGSYSGMGDYNLYVVDNKGNTTQLTEADADKVTYGIYTMDGVNVDVDSIYHLDAGYYYLKYTYEGVSYRIGITVNPIYDQRSYTIKFNYDSALHNDYNYYQAYAGFDVSVKRGQDNVTGFGNIKALTSDEYSNLNAKNTFAEKQTYLNDHGEYFFYDDNALTSLEVGTYYLTAYVENTGNYISGWTLPNYSTQVQVRKGDYLNFLKASLSYESNPERYNEVVNPEVSFNYGDNNTTGNIALSTFSLNDSNDYLFGATMSFVSPTSEVNSTHNGTTRNARIQLRELNADELQVARYTVSESNGNEYNVYYEADYVTKNFNNVNQNFPVTLHITKGELNAPTFITNSFAYNGQPVVVRNNISDGNFQTYFEDGLVALSTTGGYVAQATNVRVEPYNACIYLTDKTNWQWSYWTYDPEPTLVKTTDDVIYSFTIVKQSQTYYDISVNGLNYHPTYNQLTEEYEGGLYNSETGRYEVDGVANGQYTFGIVDPDTEILRSNGDWHWAIKQGDDIIAQTSVAAGTKTYTLTITKYGHYTIYISKDGDSNYYDMEQNSFEIYIKGLTPDNIEEINAAFEAVEGNYQNLVVTDDKIYITADLIPEAVAGGTWKVYYSGETEALEVGDYVDMYAWLVASDLFKNGLIIVKFEPTNTLYSVIEFTMDIAATENRYLTNPSNMRQLLQEMFTSGEVYTEERNVVFGADIYTFNGESDELDETDYSGTITNTAGTLTLSNDTENLMNSY